LCTVMRMQKQLSDMLSALYRGRGLLVDMMIPSS
jgi:hypothetical protein